MVVLFLINTLNGLNDGPSESNMKLICASVGWCCGSALRCFNIKA